MNSSSKLLCFESIDIIISWCPIFVIWTKWSRANCSRNLTTLSSLPAIDQSTCKLHQKLLLNIFTLRKHSWIPTIICEIFQAKEHSVNLLILKSTFWKSTGRYTLIESKSLFRKGGFWPEKVLPMSTTVPHGSTFQKSGSRNISTMRFQAKYNTWAEATSKILLKASKKSTAIAHT